MSQVMMIFSACGVLFADYGCARSREKVAIIETGANQYFAMSPPLRTASDARCGIKHISCSSCVDKYFHNPATRNTVCGDRQGDLTSELSQ